MIGLVSCSKKLDVASTQSTASTLRGGEDKLARTADRRRPAILTRTIGGSTLSRALLAARVGAAGGMSAISVTYSSTNDEIHLCNS